MVHIRDTGTSFENILDNSKANSGGEQDLSFLRRLISNNLLETKEFALKRTVTDINEEYYQEKYRKMNYESTRHYLCRAVIQEELKKLGINNTCCVDVGNMDLLRSNSSYDIAADDLSFIIDVGLTPARNFFKGLSDLRVGYYLVTTYFDDYMDDIVFFALRRTNDELFLKELSGYKEEYRELVPESIETLLSDKLPF
ncbi:MAG: hypothetical protein GX660_11015 [Clostridiaceae bacterium]|nr:hypothetical protein [Clostridiaceae bacterium]